MINAKAISEEIMSEVKEFQRERVKRMTIAYFEAKSTIDKMEAELDRVGEMETKIYFHEFGHCPIKPGTNLFSNIRDMRYL